MPPPTDDQPRKSGPPKGVRYGGRVAGTKNKATIERELKAAIAIDKARKNPREMATSVIERLMKVAEGATDMHRPPSLDQVEAAAKAGQALALGDWGLCGEWFDRTAYCAKELAKYQSAPIKSVEAPAPPPDQKAARRRFGLRVFEGGRPLTPTSDTE
jgi:hypothetical protein